MNSGFSSYLLFAKEQLPPDQLAGTLKGYDLFASAYNKSHRVREVFKQVGADAKHWLMLPEYSIPSDEDIIDGTRIDCTSSDEAELILDYFRAYPPKAAARICIDSTGFIRPHLLFLLRYLYEEGCGPVDIIYSEPLAYQHGSQTKFSFPIREVRQVRGFEGSHSPEADGDYLVVGCGYDTNLMAQVANNRYQATKVQMFPFPALRPHMYQENRLRTQLCEASFGRVLSQCFAPGYDPFATAHVLSRFFSDKRPLIKNLYLSPLATKPQVIGFGLFYLMECLAEPVSIVFPFSDGYNHETSTGLSEVWKYTVDFNLVRALNAIP